MKHQQLTNSKIKKLDKPGFYLDGVGLYLQVSQFVNKDTGKHTKNWVFRYTIDGRVRDMGLGAWPTTSLSDARNLAGEQRDHVKRGDDPLELKQAKIDKRRSDALKNILFRDAAEDYLKLYSDTWKNDKHRAQWKSTLEQYAYPSLGSRRALDIDAALVNDAVAGIWKKTPETASRVKQRIDRVIKWVREGKPLPKGAIKKGHHKAMPLAELPAFIGLLRGKDIISARALEVTILTALRTSEVIGARWSEIDFDKKVWTIPASRMKAGKEHNVPLSKRVVEILKSQPRVKGNPHIFPGAKNATLSNMAMLELLRGTAGNGYTTHGFRSTFRDWAGDSTSFPRDVIEFSLAHQIPDKTEKAYRRGDALEKRRALMEDWARVCSGDVGVSSATPMRKRA